jgi:tripartite-type tricarboxylate transporter receptor subunit TctC
VKRLFAALLAVACVLGVSPTAAQDWPNKPVRIVNTFAPGGAADYLARTVADNLSTVFGQQFYVETRSGAAGAIGVNSVVATPPDGYNFVITNITMLVLAPIANPRLGYHPERDLTNIAYLGGSPIMLSVNSKSPIKTLADFVDSGKKSGKPLTYSSSGVGSSGHLFGETFAHKVGIKVEHVPYKGAAQGLLDLVGGHIVWSAQTVTSSAGQVRAGTLRGLAADVRRARSWRVQHADLVLAVGAEGTAGVDPRQDEQRDQQGHDVVGDPRSHAARRHGGRGDDAATAPAVDRNRDAVLAAGNRAGGADAEVMMSFPAERESARTGIQREKAVPGSRVSHSLARDTRPLTSS